MKISLGSMVIGETLHITAKTNLFDAGAKVAGQGHYLERLEGLCKVFGLKDLQNLCEAVAKYVLSSHKPNWVDGLVKDVSDAIIFRAEKFNPTPEDWAKIVWGLDYDSLQENNLTQYRTLGK